MTVTSQHIERVRALVERAIGTLTDANIPRVQLAEFVPATRRLFIPRKAHFVTLGTAWPLGVLLIAPTGELHQAGEATRAVPPGHPGHVSVERERRREYTRIAYESGFETGEVVYFDSPPLRLTVGTSLPRESVLAIQGDRVLVRWNAQAPIDSAVPIERYLAEQVELRVEREQHS